MGFVIKNNIKMFLNRGKLRLGTGTCEILDNKIEGLLKDACKRAEMNKRSTVMPQDL